MVPRRAAVVVALVLVAGCAGTDQTTPTTAPESTTTAANATLAAAQNETVTNASSTAATASRTTTTTSVTAATTTLSPPPNASLPPGVNASGVRDASTLVAAHRTALNDTSFAFRFHANVSVGPANQWTRQRGTVEAGLSPLVVHSDSVRRFEEGTTRVTTDLWANQTAVVVRYSGENRTEIRRYNRTGGNLADETWAHLPRADLDSQVTQAWLVELALTAGEFEFDRIERRDGRKVAVLRATEAVSADNFTDFDATAVVDAKGRVHSLSLTAAYAGDDETRIHYEFELTDLGSVSVERPTWVGAATPPTKANATTTVSERNTTATAE
ncbi:hypothetical protein [Halorussus sp. MSC15.2]|uniref:hypothetical protein n=1 Tax=Halorussus sp. MSC15.2 TaxID=2283638 RepID=UPI0013D163BC|nr:hypothetical protein [Halorussus sp. MSC15.2]NEU57660.1 hypothetical protein [Halorussus sp. MSC15.2]